LGDWLRGAYLHKMSRDIKKENSGDFSGAPSFQGGPYGYGGKAQMAKPESQVPKDFEEILGKAVENEIESLFGLSEEVISERDSSDANYRDLPGFPAMDTLVSKQTFVPEDPAERQNQDMLGPTIDQVPIDDLVINNWKATTPGKAGKLTTVINTLVDQGLEENMTSTGPGIWSTWKGNKLVAQRDWQQENDPTGDITADSNISGMGKLVKPRTFVPKSVDNKHENLSNLKNNEVFSQGENMSIKKIYEAIKKLVVQELEEADVKSTALASDPVLQWQKQIFDDVISKHGGDYQKAQKSPEWAQAMKKAEEVRTREIQSQNIGLPRPMQGKSDPTSGVASMDIRQRLKGTKPAAGTSQAPQDLSHLFPKEWQPGPKPVGENIDIDLDTNSETSPSEPPFLNDFLDDEKAKLLFDFINEDVEMYQAGILPVVNILRRKFLAGSEHNGFKLWYIIALAGAKKYNRTHKEQVDFSPSTKRETSRRLHKEYSPYVRSLEKKLF
jgi:hypothetical protein